MSKFFLFISFLWIAVILMFSLYGHNQPLMWLASSEKAYDIIRVAILTTLLILLVTKPPRKTYFRYFVGLAAIGLSAWSVMATYQGTMNLLDTSSILVAGISMGIVSLEGSPDKVKGFAQAGDPVHFTVQTN